MSTRPRRRPLRARASQLKVGWQWVSSTVGVTGQMQFIGLVPWGVGGHARVQGHLCTREARLALCVTLLSPDIPTPGISMKRWCKEIKKAGWHLPSQPLGRACWNAEADSVLRRPGTTRRCLPFTSSPHPPGQRGPWRAGGGAQGTWDLQACQRAGIPA